MAALTATMLTTMDWAKRRDPDGKIAKIAEILAQQNDILQDMVWREGNLPTGHMATLRTQLPTVGWRAINEGASMSKSNSSQVTFETGILEVWSEVDCKLAELEGNVDEFRDSESVAFLEAMNQEVVQTMIYGNQGTAPKEFTGLAPYYNAISGASNASHVLSGGGSGADNSSIWLCGWSEQTVFGTFPKGAKALGLNHEYKGKVTVQSNGIGGTRLDVYQDKYEWTPGLVLRDWRFVGRICNIDISNLIALSSNADLPTLMIKMFWRVPRRAGIKYAWYMNRTTAEMLDIICRNNVSTGGQLKYSEVDGKEIVSFRGYPVRIVDQLLETEATIS